jgi:hypothetical protein
MKLSEATYWVEQEDELNKAAERRSRDILLAVAEGIDVDGTRIQWDQPEPGCLWVSNGKAGVLLSVSPDGEISLQRHDGAFRTLEAATLENAMKAIARSLRSPAETAAQAR